MALLYPSLGRLSSPSDSRRRAALAHPLGRKRLKELATLATPDTLMRWYHRLIAEKFDGSKTHKELGRPRVPEEVEQLAVQMAEENPTWGYGHIQGALANLGHHIDKITVPRLIICVPIVSSPGKDVCIQSYANCLALDFFLDSGGTITV